MTVAMIIIGFFVFACCIARGVKGFYDDWRNRGGK